MKMSVWSVRSRWPAAATVALIAVNIASAQAPPAQVRFTPAREHDVHRTIRLTGSVESRTSSVVASEVAGLVVAVEAREGDWVRKDQPLIRLRTDWYDLLLQEAEGRLQEAQARLALAESSLRRSRDLFDEEVVSQQDLDDATSEYTAWQGREIQSRAEIAQLKLSLDRLTIRAPFTGVVVRKLTDLGQWITAGGDVVDMVELGKLDVRVEVPERYYGGLTGGVEAAVSFDALSALQVTGRLIAIIPRADPQARTFPIKLRVPNPDSRIGVGMLATVDLPIGASHRGLIVPKDAVVRQGPTVLVYRIGEGEVVEPIPVQAGQGLGAWIVVEGPLAAGDRVVTRGNERLQPGQTVVGEPQEYAVP
jgi:RND family efflux transporter MFP subunit